MAITGKCFISGHKSKEKINEYTDLIGFVLLRSTIDCLPCIVLPSMYNDEIF